MKKYNVLFTFVDGSKENMQIEAYSAKVATNQVTDRDWFMVEDNGHIRTVNMKNVLKIEVNEDGEEFYLDQIDF